MERVRKRCSKFCSKLFLVVAMMLMTGVLCPQANVEAKAKAKTPTITVKKIDQKTAKKVHQQLMKGKAFTIKFKCSEKNFYKKFKKLTAKVAKQTGVGFDVFPICMKDSLYFGISGGRNPKKSGQYTTFKVTKSDCSEYIYGIKFAEREYKDFKAYIKKVLTESENNYAGLQNCTIDPQPGAQKDKATLLSETGDTIASLKELDRYLNKTKFRNLSGAMKARIVLPIGVNAKPWGKCAMRHNYNRVKRFDSFKALYRRTAYAGSSIAGHARTLCKICAVFSIGDYDNIKGKIDKTTIEAIRVKVKTFGGKTRYAILEGGAFDPYNDYIGFETWAADTLYRRQDKQAFKSIKKININVQQLKMIEPQGWLNEAYNVTTGEKVMMYHFGLSKSEW